MPTKYKGTQKETNALSLIISFLRCHNKVMSNLRSSFGEFTESQFAVLELLLHLGPQNQKAIAQKILKSTSNIVTVIDNLEKNNLVKRLRSTEDRRNFIIELTDLGKVKIQKQFKIHLQVLVKELDILNDDEKELFMGLCKKLGGVNK